MLNFSVITSALQATLEADADLSAAGFKIEVGDYVNTDPNRAPWLGIYRTSIQYDPRTCGRSDSSWQGIITLRLIIQATHMQSGAACEARLEGYIKNVLDAVWADETWQATVDMVTGLDVEYSYKEDEQQSIYFQWAMVTVKADARTG